MHDVQGICRITNDWITASPANFHTEPRSFEAMRTEWTDTNRRYPWVVAAQRDTVVGYARAGSWMGRRAYDWTAFVTVYVDADWHGRGLGRSLYEQLLQILEAQGYRRLIAGITVPNDASIGLHQRMGFTPIGTIDHAGWKFDDWHSVRLMQRPLGHGADTPPTPLKPVAEVT